MKAISLWQPWASLSAHGLKRIETRSWATSYRGPVLIHAAKRWGVEQRETRARLVRLFAWPQAVDEDGFTDLPLGALVAVARVVDVRLMTPEWIAEQTPLERVVGDWQPGRYGWVLEDVQRLDPPIPLRGRQGLFEVRTSDLRVADVERIARLAPLEGLR